MSLARLRLSAPRNEHRPVLAMDVAHEHFFLTRDKGMRDVQGYVQRYSYKVDHNEINMALADSFRIKLPKYRGSIMGRVHESEYELVLNPLALEGCPRDSSLLTLICPPNVDNWTKELYERQIRTLEEVVAMDLQLKPGVVDQNWTEKREDGTMSIKILVCIHPDRLCAELPVGQDLDITVNLSKDEYLGGDGTLHKRFVLWTTCYMTDLSIARRGLNSERHPNQPLFGSDILDQHYTSTRDGTLEDINGTYSRYTYKPLIHQSPITGPASMEPFRKYYVQYRALIIVEVDSLQVMYHDNPMGKERNGQLCTRVTTRCPTGADSDTVKLFNMQVAKLQAVIDEDLEESPGEVATNWVNKRSDGSFTIDLMIFGSPRDISMRMDLVPGSDLEVTISLCKDERVLDQELRMRSKEFSLWVRFWRRVTDAEVGRV
ncbi:hypothetical protein R3P38DRAFT_3566677 [Favolaschia claudopus]|uniref:Uncharacterized protein n=1 Tax=Favolaschia claudopus TaxID=2862362 RepID=A0AAW0DYW6_9AGAR